VESPLVIPQGTERDPFPIRRPDRAVVVLRGVESEALHPSLSRIKKPTVAVATTLVNMRRKALSVRSDIHTSIARHATHLSHSLAGSIEPVQRQGGDR